jgi:dTDP-4-dehydrorhamnose reductase
MILLTGGSGVLGASIREAAAALGVPVAAPSSAELDVRDTDACDERGRTLGPRDAVVHCAAMTDWERCHEDPRGCFAVNAAGALNVARMAAASGAFLVHVSTDGVFDGRARERPYAESDRPGSPPSVYGVSKLAAEHLVAVTCRDALVVRLGWLFGPPPAEDAKFVGAIIRRAWAGQPLAAVSDKVGTLSYAPHAAEKIVRYAVGRTAGVRHLANEGVVSRLDVARFTLSLWAPGSTIREAASDEFPSPVVRPDFSALATTFDDARLPHWQDAVAAHFERHSPAGR